MSDQNDHHQDLSFTSRGAQEAKFYLASGIDTLDSRRCLSMGLEQAMTAAYKSYFQKAFRLNRRLLGLKFAEAEAKLDNEIQESRLSWWMVTVNFWKANGDPFWQPDLDSPTIFIRCNMLERWKKSLSSLKYCYEWSKKHKVLHVHFLFHWIGNGSKDTILKRFQDAFSKYINQASDVDVKKCNKNNLPYLKKDGKPDSQSFNSKFRAKYGLEDLYPRAKAKKPSAKETKKDKKVS